MPRFCSIAAVSLSVSCGSQFVVSAGDDGFSEEGFQISFQMPESLSASQRHIFTSAGARWSEAIVVDLPGLRVDQSVLPEECNIGDRAGPVEIDDLLIYVGVEPIDGSNRTVAKAGPCAGRRGDGSPLVGLITVDEADLDTVEARGQLHGVILHEIGHVLGFGSLGDSLGLVASPSLPDNPGADTHFVGPQAKKAWMRVGGEEYSFGDHVPLENSAKEGPADHHWRESVFRDELMSPSFDSGDSLPLSEVTIAALEDMGFWEVDYSAADDYQLPGPHRIIEKSRQRRRFGCLAVEPTISIDEHGNVFELKDF